MADCDASLRPAMHPTYGTSGASHNYQDSPHHADKFQAAVYDVQRNLLSGRPMYLGYSKDEFTGILLGTVGPCLLCSDVVDALFHEIDREGNGNGLIDAEQIARYLYLLDVTAPPDSNDFLFKNLATFLFLCASSISIANNLFRRTHGACILTAAALIVTAWLSLVASGMFVWKIFCFTLCEKELIMLLKRNLTLGQIINLSWLLGSLSYVTAVHGSELFMFPEDIPPKLWVVGGAAYFLGGLLSVPHICSEAHDQHKQHDDMMHKIRSFTDSSNSYLSDVEVTYAVEEDDDFSAISLKKLNIESVFPDTEQESKTLDTELMTQFTGSVCAEPIIGKDIDAPDSSSICPRFHIDCQELYNYLEGPIDIDIFIHVVQAIVADGSSTAVNFSEYAVETWWNSSRIKFIRKLSMLPSFYIAIMYAVAGGLFTLGAYEDEMPTTKVQNMFLAASSLYLCGSTYSLCQSWKTINNKWSLFHSCRLALRHRAFPMNELMVPSHSLNHPAISYELV